MTDNLFGRLSPPAQKVATLALRMAIADSRTEIDVEHLTAAADAMDNPNRIRPRDHRHVVGAARSFAAALPPAEARILAGRFPLAGRPESYEQIAAVLGVTRERVRTGEARAVRLLAEKIQGATQPWW